MISGADRRKKLYREHTRELCTLNLFSIHFLLSLFHFQLYNSFPLFPSLKGDGKVSDFLVEDASSLPIFISPFVLFLLQSSPVGRRLQEKEPKKSRLTKPYLNFSFGG